MAVLNLGHCKTGTNITSSSPAIPQARVLARLQRRQGVGRRLARRRVGERERLRIAGGVRDPHRGGPRRALDVLFEGLQVTSDCEQTIISGPLTDQPALHGVLAKVRDLGLCLISVRRLGPDEAGKPTPQ